MYKYLIIFIFLLSPCHGSEEIVVHLSSSTPCYKTYIEIKDLSKELLAVLKYDIAHNGFCALTDKKKDASLLIEGTSSATTLTVTVKQIAPSRTIELKALSLTGDLAKDRCKLHAASDLISKELFGITGIASNRILYTSCKKEGNDSSKWTADVWVADYDGANAKRLTNDNALCMTPILIPSKVGTTTLHFFYVSYKEGEPKIFLGGNGAPKRLTYIPGNQLMPTITRQLDRVAFISTVHGREDLFIQPFSLQEGVIGKAKKLFSAPMATQGTPTFSPDGKKIAFVSNKDGTARIYWMKVPGTGESQKNCPLYLISKKNRENTAPHWSQDGSKIAYSALTGGVRQIWIYDMEKDLETQLTFGEEHKENPVWASDNIHLMYNTASHEKAELYIIDTNQKRPTKIALGPKDKRFPTWEG